MPGMGGFELVYQPLPLLLNQRLTRASLPRY